PLVEQQAHDRQPATKEPIRVPEWDAREQHVQQPALKLALLEYLVPAEQHGGIGRDVGLDEVHRVELAKDLNDFRLGRRIVFELAADQVPAFADGALAVE